jgi:hypothetical protein
VYDLQLRDQEALAREAADGEQDRGGSS